VPQPKRGLGKGLGALIPSPSASTDGVEEIDLTLIAPNPHQPRHTWRAEALGELADSIREHGIIQPLIVTRSTEPASATPYTLIAGERRWQAAQLANLARVPVIVKEATPQQMLELALVENIQRADLNPLEEANAYRQLIDEFGLTQEQVADKVGKSRVAVANAVRLLRLPDRVKEALAENSISEGHARALLALENEALQNQTLGLIVSKALNVRQTEELVRRLLDSARKEKPARQNTPESPQTRALEADFESALGTPVKLSRSRRGGKLVIQFYSEEELQSIYDAIVGPART
jgi:ParB family transcriptional regulator, chromosome partitioning protein